MSYQVLARKWRPQQFDDVVGQPAVTRTLKNAIGKRRIAQAFVFAGPRGVGKTTTARILARALNCETGPTAEPCGLCDACREIAEGRDIDVLEIDAATHTQVDNVREVIIAGLAITPVRDRYKIFIIDEVHQLSSHSFNALLKSIEEPPPHVVFMMATTELSKIPDTVLSRAQVFEFRTISSTQIADQLRRIAEAEGIAASDEALLLIARAAEGSMRDAESAFDQVLAFAGQSVTAEDVATVLGLVGRDLIFDIVTAVADETPASAFELAGRAVELGYDLRQVCRELSRVVRDLLVVSVDPSRLNDPEIAAESERAQLESLSRRFSREDLLRSFDVIARAETDIRAASQPRYHLEMALLRWIHLRKLVPLTELLGGTRDEGRGTKSVQSPVASLQAPVASRQSPVVSLQAPVASPQAPVASRPRPATIDQPPREAFLDEIRRSKEVFYKTVVAQAQKIEFESDRVVFSFLPIHRMQREKVEEQRQWLEAVATKISGRKMGIAAVQVDLSPAAPQSNGGTTEAKPVDLKATALSDPSVQAMLDVFPAEIEDVEEI
jgi:DNA polymerase-3 subunit gamma/tau